MHAEGVGEGSLLGYGRPLRSTLTGLYKLTLHVTLAAVSLLCGMHIRPRGQSITDLVQLLKLESLRLVELAMGADPASTGVIKPHLDVRSYHPHL